MLYSVKLISTSFFGVNKTYSKVKGDFIGRPEDGLKNVRVLILEDETRVEVPINSYIIEFSKERFFSLKRGMEKESGQKLSID